MRMNIMKSFRIIVLVVFGLWMTVSAQKKELPIQPINQKELVERHNYYRAKVGVPPLVWSDELATYAQKWANKLSNSCSLTHSSGPYGENLYYTTSSASATDVVDLWASEEEFFNHRNTVYKAGSSRKSGHYSQIIWRETTAVGGAMQKCKHGGEIWVCSYSPYGNVVGAKTY